MGYTSQRLCPRQFGFWSAFSGVQRLTCWVIGVRSVGYTGSELYLPKFWAVDVLYICTFVDWAFVFS